MLNEGLDRITDLISADITDGLAGTDNTTPTATQTGLIAPTAATEANVTVIKSTRAFQSTHVISSATAAGTSFVEWSVRQNADATDVCRSVTASVSHTANDEISKITTFDILGNE